METWRKIHGFENYSVSADGRVRNDVTNTIKTISLDHAGYCSVLLHANGMKKKSYVHRLVAIAFIDNPLQKREVNHIDGNKQNNSVSNLEWVTSSENKRHNYDVLGYKQHPQSAEARAKISAYFKGRTSPNKGKPMSKEQKFKLSKKVICLETNVIYESVKQARTETGIWRVTDSIRTGKAVKGYHFKFVSEED